ncbi:MAG: hypothetical protein WAP51_01880 [Candidatus Sungiibacteriota bacterium]
MFAIAGTIFAVFVLVYAFLVASVLYHLRQYTLPGWTATRIVVPIFFIISTIFLAFATYFFFTTSWEQF